MVVVVAFATLAASANLGTAHAQLQVMDW